jgi:hypothetical protein
MPLHFDKMFSKYFGVIFLIVYHDFNISVEEYENRSKKNDFPTVEQCPHCKS